MNQICTFDYEIAVTYPDGKVIEDNGEFEITFSDASLRELDEVDLYGELMYAVLDAFHHEMDERGGLLDNPNVSLSIHHITWENE